MAHDLEKDIQADVVKLLETVGAAVYKIGTTLRNDFPDGWALTCIFAVPHRTPTKVTHWRTCRGIW